jgi:hypothetical protein
LSLIPFDEVAKSLLVSRSALSNRRRIIHHSSLTLTYPSYV